MEDRREPEANGLPEASDLGQNRERFPDSVHESQRQYSTLLEINNAVISKLTRESLFHAISEALRKVVPFDRALLLPRTMSFARSRWRGRSCRGTLTVRTRRSALRARRQAGRLNTGSRASATISPWSLDFRVMRSCSPEECVRT